MRYSEWEPLYSGILEDMGYSREEDESSVRVLKAVTLNSDLVDPDDVRERFGPEATVFGDADRLESDVSAHPPVGTLICSGSAVGRVMALGIMPDAVVTDLDGDIGPQLEASARGAVTFVHAHGDNGDLVMSYAGLFRGPVVLTTQSRPENTVFNFGGFTDGDRAVCIAQEMGCRRILLEGFDLDRPRAKEGSDPAVKARKLRWAGRVMDSLRDVEIVRL
ncbi:6-hydroxymethylpterin diphosphokinase MptE-like protein [Candidatus Methanoprimaticola sp. MG2]|uniref:6-hydroxymethylpterin diphosphokinase MptE-like protein n=1 Tax=Candidatus Methanoprimaticola sp. MG2 TaxID=3228838 RepID=UPI0039C601C6